MFQVYWQACEPHVLSKGNAGGTSKLAIPPYPGNGVAGFNILQWARHLLTRLTSGEIKQLLRFDDDMILSGKAGSTLLTSTGITFGNGAP